MTLDRAPVSSSSWSRSTRAFIWDSSPWRSCDTKTWCYRLALPLGTRVVFYPGFPLPSRLRHRKEDRESWLRDSGFQLGSLTQVLTWLKCQEKEAKQGPGGRAVPGYLDPVPKSPRFLPRDHVTHIRPPLAFLTWWWQGVIGLSWRTSWHGVTAK